MIRVLSILVFVFAAGTLQAKETTTKLTAMESFEEQRSEILEGLKKGGVYSNVSKHNEKLVKDALGRMSATLEGVQEIDQLTTDSKAMLFNDQELVNTVLTMADQDNQRPCTRRHRVGSHFKVTECETIEQRRERQERDRQNLERLQQGMGALPSGG